MSVCDRCHTSIGSGDAIAHIGVSTVHRNPDRCVDLLCRRIEDQEIELSIRGQLLDVIKSLSGEGTWYEAVDVLRELIGDLRSDDVETIEELSGVYWSMSDEIGALKGQLRQASEQVTECQAQSNRDLGRKRDADHRFRRLAVAVEHALHESGVLLCDSMDAANPECCETTDDVYEWCDRCRVGVRLLAALNPQNPSLTNLKGVDG